MEGTVLKEVYELLRSIGAVANEAEFSRAWLGRSESYVCGLRFKGLGASTGSLAICTSKLQHYGLQHYGLQMCESAVTGSLASSSKS